MSIGADIAIDEDKGRAGDRPDDPQPLRQPLRKGRLPRAQIAGQRNNRAGNFVQQARQFRAEPLRLRCAVGFQTKMTWFHKMLAIIPRAAGSWKPGAGD